MPVSSSDQYSLTNVDQGFWSAAVQYTAPAGGSLGSILVQSLGTGSVSITGIVAAAGNTIQATFSPPSVTPFNLILSAVCDIAGGALFTDGSAYYLLASGALSAGSTYSVVAGFGHFSEALAPPVCLAAGTRVQTARGMVEVEALQLSDRLFTQSGDLRPIQWIGRQTLRCCSFAPPSAVWPVCIAPGAFGERLPERKLLLSPNHSVVVGGQLVPIRLLTNDASIRAIPTDRVTYYHVELATHDALVAEGLPVETYLDQDHRQRFQSLSHSGQWVRNREHRSLSPVAAPVVSQLPFLPYAGPETDLQAVRATLLSRAIALGFRLTGDVRLRFRTAGGFLPTEWDGVTARADVPQGVDEVMLLSDVATPSSQSTSDDQRSLGAAVVQIELDGRRMEIDDFALHRGWYPVEDSFRWTNGSASIKLERSEAKRRLAVQTAPMLKYWASTERTHE